MQTKGICAQKTEEFKLNMFHQHVIFHFYQQWTHIMTL